jgi:hypothetical protein
VPGDAAGEYQAEVTILLLEAIGDAGFALAGSGAIRAHGLTDRPTQDVDLFTVSTTGEREFGAAVSVAEEALRGRGYRVTRPRSAPLFARLMVESEDRLVLEVDLGVDWRLEPPVRLDLGPVLSVRDAVGSKVAAAFSRGEVRDFLDVDAIRESGRLADSELLHLAKEHDGGFDDAAFASQLERFARLGPERSQEYGVEAAAHAAIVLRLGAWASRLRTPRGD